MLAKVYLLVSDFLKRRLTRVGYGDPLALYILLVDSKYYLAPLRIFKKELALSLCEIIIFSGAEGWDLKCSSTTP